MTRLTAPNLRKHPKFRSAKGAGTVPPMERPVLYKCPHTGMNVQHWLADAPEDAKDGHSPVSCPACTRTHFIHTRPARCLAR